MIENLQAYYDACKQQYASQDAERRHLSIKTLGMLTFGVALAGASISLLNGNISSGWILTSAYTISISVFIMILLGLFVLLPQSWNQEFEITDLRKLLMVKSDEFVLAMADAHKRAITKNWTRLAHKNRLVQAITILAAIEVSAFIALRLLVLAS